MIAVFFLGATGHIGRAVVHNILAQFPNVEIAALVRNQLKAQRLKQTFPRLRAVIGDLKDVALIENESKVAGIVINTSPDQLNESHAAIRAALRGLASRSQKGHYIQTSGAFLIAEGECGETASVKVWNDIVDIEQLTTMPPDRYHQRTDQIVRDGASSVNVAIVAPTVVYGLSPSTENQVPITIRDIIATVRELSAGFTMSRGRNILGYVHVNDLAKIYVGLFADAVNGAGNSDARLWGPHAYYFANVEELTFAEYMKILVKILKANGLISTDRIKEIGIESDASELELVNKTAMAHGCGASVRCRSERAETLLGWKPKERSVKETLPGVIDLLLSRDLN